MKALTDAFPLLKKKRFYLFFALILLFCALTGLLYTREESPLPLSFEEEKEAVEKALAIAEESLLTCGEEDRPRFSQEKAFYENALRFELSPWGSDFAYEGLSLYAALSLKGGQEDTLQKLEEILTRQDALALYELCQKDPDLPDLDKRRLTTADPPSPGKSTLLYEIALLEQSLAEGTDLYFVPQTKLSEKNGQLLEKLLRQKEKTLLSGRYNPVPLNEETLLASETFAACLVSLLLLAVAGYGKAETDKSRFRLFLIPLTVTALLSIGTLVSATLLFAPGTVQPLPLQWGGSLPFFPGVFLRFFCRVIGSLPLMLLCFLLRRRGKARAWKLLSILPALRVLFSGVTSAVSLFTLGDLARSIFPELSALSPRPFAPWAGVLLWGAALGTGLFLLWKKEQKITDEKQELSLEKEREL